jgi:ribonuclease HI
VLTEAVIYTDGSSGNSGDGGWAALVATPYFGVEICGWSAKTTNNRMEMIAALEGMKLLTNPHEVHLVSDSAYLVNAIKNDWYVRWLDEVGSARPNLDLWVQIQHQVHYHKVVPHKIKGHNGHEHNERVDKLAVAARKEKLEKVNFIYGNPSS